MTFVGSVVSIDCGEVLGTYQGVVISIDKAKNDITIGKPFRNGTQCQHQAVTIRAGDIKDLNIIKNTGDAQCLPEIRHGPVSSPAACRHPEGTAAPARASSAELHMKDRNPSPMDTICTQNSHRSRSRHEKHKDKNRTSPFKNTNSGYTGEANRTPRHYHSDGYNSDSHRNGLTPTQLFEDYNGRGSNRRGGSSSSTPRRAEDRRNGRQPREDCFSAPVDTYLDDDFDFEKNLALFDKRAVFREIEDAGGSPVRPADTRNPAKYKHDENVLDSGPVVYRRIQVNGDRVSQEYVTDTGLVVPCISHTERCKILAAAESFGLSKQRQLEMVGRSCSEMVMQLVGGSNRLNPQNTHQQPRVAVLCGPHMQGAMGVNCARQLAMHNVKVTVFVPNFQKVIEDLEVELRLYDLTKGTRTTNVQDLSDSGLDLIVNALDNHENRHLLSGQLWYKCMSTWANSSRAPVLSIDPPVEGCSIDTKWSLALVLPLALSDRCGQVYLCDLNIPSKVFKDSGIRYNSPFANKFVIPLHSTAT